MSYVGESMHEISVANGWYVTWNTLLKFVVSLCCRDGSSLVINGEREPLKLYLP